MRITYIHHSGFLAETEHALLLFDYVGGPLPELPPEKDLIVFVSHRHPDHFSPEIFSLANIHPRITYVLSDDIWQNKVPEEHFCRTRFMDPGKVTCLNAGGGIRITAFHSTDEGVAYMVETDGKLLYHAGDLNDWQWPGESAAYNHNMHANYLRELNKMAELGMQPDAAMLPLDGRQEELYSLGLDEFMRTVGADAVFPMHFWENYELIGHFKALSCTEPYRDKIREIQAEGEVFEL